LTGSPSKALSATTGATLKELMARLGHSSVRAALIYQLWLSEKEHKPVT